MTQINLPPEVAQLQVGSGEDVRQIAFSQNKGNGDRPGLMFLAGFKSDMMGSKAQYLVELGKKDNRDIIRFDYSGHGQSGGAFLEGTISKWLEEAKAVFAACASGPTILVGSSMGGWISMLLNQALRAEGDDRVAGIVLIAPAVDMTKDLMLDTFSESERAELAADARVTRPSDYGEPYILTKNLLDDGAHHLMFGTKIRSHCPVHILQGGLDLAVPVAHSQKLVDHLLLDPVTMSLVPDGDHSLSRPEDLELLGRAIHQMDEDVRPS